MNKKMDSQKLITLGYFVSSYFSSILRPDATDGDKLRFFSSKTNIDGRSLLTLMQYLQQHIKFSERINVVLTYESNAFWPNGTWQGDIEKINHSEIDVGVTRMNIVRMQ